MEEEILLKNGEIRVLRDSLKGAQQEKETQRQSYIQLESQRQKEHSDREKELNKKVRNRKPECRTAWMLLRCNDALSLFRFILCSRNCSSKKQRSMK